MLAAAGAIIPEGLAANGADIKGATWCAARVQRLDAAARSGLIPPSSCARR